MPQLWVVQEGQSSCLVNLLFTLQVNLSLVIGCVQSRSSTVSDGDSFISFNMSRTNFLFRHGTRLSMQSHRALLDSRVLAESAGGLGS